VGDIALPAETPCPQALPDLLEPGRREVIATSRLSSATDPPKRAALSIQQTRFWAAALKPVLLEVEPVAPGNCLGRICERLPKTFARLGEYRVGAACSHRQSLPG